MTLKSLQGEGFSLLLEVTLLEGHSCRLLLFSRASSGEGGRGMGSAGRPGRSKERFTSYSARPFPGTRSSALWDHPQAVNPGRPGRRWGCALASGQWPSLPMGGTGLRPPALQQVGSGAERRAPRDPPRGPPPPPFPGPAP